MCLHWFLACSAIHLTMKAVNQSSDQKTMNPTNWWPHPPSYTETSYVVQRILCCCYHSPKHDGPVVAHEWRQWPQRLRPQPQWPQRPQQPQPHRMANRHCQLGMPPFFSLGRRSATGEPNMPKQRVAPARCAVFPGSVWRFSILRWSPRDRLPLPVCWKIPCSCACRPTATRSWHLWLEALSFSQAGNRVSGQCEYAYIFANMYCMYIRSGVIHSPDSVVGIVLCMGPGQMKMCSSMFVWQRVCISVVYHASLISSPLTQDLPVSYMFWFLFSTCYMHMETKPMHVLLPLHINHSFIRPSIHDFFGCLLAHVCNLFFSIPFPSWFSTHTHTKQSNEQTNWYQRKLRILTSTSESTKVGVKGRRGAEMGREFMGCSTHC